MKETIVVVTGAGISAAAGIPTYRAENGVWADKNFERMSHARNYGNYLHVLVPKWVRLMREFSKAKPTRAHLELAARGWPVITQNIDGLHSLAGSPLVQEIHGTMGTWRCLRGKHEFPGKELLSQAPVLDEGEAYRCPLCQSPKIRPLVVLFGERLREPQATKQLLQQATTLVFIGTSGNVEPAASWHLQAKRSILVDPNPWGEFSTIHETTADEWAASGCPL